MNVDDSHTVEITARGHEPIGVSVRFVVLGATGLVVLILLTTWAMGGVLRLLSYGAAGQGGDAPLESSARTVGLGLNQAAERQAMDAQQERWLSEYAWLDKEEQTARIPVARAMQIMAERGIGVVAVSGDAPPPTEAQDSRDPSIGDGQ